MAYAALCTVTSEVRSHVRSAFLSAQTQIAAACLQVGTPLTHKHFLRRHNGTYGPGIKAGEGTFPFQKTKIPGLLACGDSTFPGIGLPAVAASGAVAANSLVPIWDHWKMLDEAGC